MASVAYTFHNVFPISPEAERERLGHRESTNVTCQSEAKGRRESYIDLDEQLETQRNEKGTTNSTASSDRARVCVQYWTRFAPWLLRDPPFSSKEKPAPARNSSRKLST